MNIKDTIQAKDEYIWKDYYNLQIWWEAKMNKKDTS